MTEKLLAEKGLAHIFDLLKQLSINYNSIIVLLTQKIENDARTIQEMHNIQFMSGIGAMVGDERKEEG